MTRDKTSLFALLAAAVILGSVGIKSYFDYRLAVETKHDTAAPAPPETPEPTTAEAEKASIDRLPRSVLPPIPSEILNAQAPDSPGAASPPPPSRTSAEPPRSSAEIDALRQETALYQEKLDQLRAGRPSSTGSSSLPPPRAPSPAAPATPLSALQAAMDPDAPLLAPEPNSGPIPPPALPGTPGAETEIASISGAGTDPAANGQTEAEIAALAEQVKRQPAIAQVVEYDAEFAFVVINGGSNRNIAPEMRLAVRRGSEILGFIKVVEVEATQAIAELMSKNKFSPTARKPQPGDDIIAFNLF